MNPVSTYYPTIDEVFEAASNLEAIAFKTPVVRNAYYSRKFQCEVYFKREDLQRVRSYKIRGAYNKISSLSAEQIENGIVCASAGNHAQGFALSCKLLKIKGVIYMPAPTPSQKIEQVYTFGEEFIEIKLTGDTFDDAYEAAKKECSDFNRTFIHPFDDEKVIEGQATVGLEILEQLEEPIDFILVPVGGGGLAAGLSSVMKILSPSTTVIGVEPMGAPSMSASMRNGRKTSLKNLDRFVDGAAVKSVGEKTFPICNEHLESMLTVHEGKICQIMLELYNRDAIILEPAGALSVSGLDQIADRIKGKTVVCVLSGGNNDITRTAEISERALLYSKLKHYFIVKFPQRSGALKEFVAEILGPDDDITHFEYTKKTNRENGPAVVGIQLKRPEDLEPLITKMKLHGFYGDYLNDKPELFQFLV